VSVTDHVPTARNGDHSDGYTWHNLANPEWAIPPDPPAIHGLLYKGKRHVISGPPESTKTLVAYLLLLEALRQGYGVAILDFEMGPHAAATLLRELGATNQELASIHYTEPEQPPTPRDIQQIVNAAQFVLIDSAAGSYDASGLDDNARKDAEQWAAQWIRPLWKQNIATVTIDHVTKDTQTRGKFVIGSERKIGQADVHLSLETLKPLNRGGTGLVKINTQRDRPGHLPRPTVYVIELVSDEQHNISWTLGAPLEVADQGGFRHTIYMERISKVMERLPDHKWSKNALESEVEGKREHVRTALFELVADGHVAVVDSHLEHPKYVLVRPFAPGSPQVRPGEGLPYLAPSPQPLQGAKEKGRSEPGEQDSPLAPPLDVYDDDIQHLLDGKADW
jgi:hypothetical protein